MKSETSPSRVTSLLCLLALPVLADFPVPYNTEPDTNSAPMPAAQVAAQMKLPPGFKATVFAAEPDVQNPIALAWDARGRLWVAENYTYAERATKFDLRLRDRVLIFEDAKGDGHFTSRKVFTDDVQMLTSVEVGRGGVWLMCPPQLLFMPCANGGDKPNGPTEVVLDGFTPPAENYHNYANGLRFGPDGWLYGRCGASAPGEIGAPGTAKDARIPLRGTMWRYHPTRKVFEALSSGCTNPWDFQCRPAATAAQPAGCRTQFHRSCKPIKQCSIVAFYRKICFLTGQKSPFTAYFLTVGWQKSPLPE